MTTFIDYPSLLKHLDSGAGYLIKPLKQDLSSRMGHLVKDRLHEIYNVDMKIPLEQMHNHIPRAAQAVDGFLLNDVTKHLYDLETDFQHLYEQVVLSIGELVGNNHFWQVTPTIRAHFPVSLPEHLKKNGAFLGHHTDSMLGHPPQEINCWIPLTDVYATASLQIVNLQTSIECLTAFMDFYSARRIEEISDPRSMFFDFLSSNERWLFEIQKNTEALTLKAGNMILFDSRCIHSPDENIEPISRFSIDLRLLEVSYNQQIRGLYRAKRTGRKFESGDVFSSNSIAQLGDLIS